MMSIFSVDESNALRSLYIEAFVDKTSDYYVRNIQERILFSDGMCYVGYLWDCFKNATAISENRSFCFLQEKSNLYIFWDIHSKDRISIPDYWKYSKESVLKMEKWDASLLSSLPEDIYIFDDTLLWSIALTHEEVKRGKRLCFFVNPL